KDKRRKGFPVHQLMAMAFLNHKPNKFTVVVDHKDNDPLNNHIDNLQLVSNRKNSSKDRKRGTSKYIGVHWSRKVERWKAVIGHNGKDIQLGTFHDEKEAALYYQNALKAINNGEEIIRKRRKKTSKYEGVY